MLAAAVLAGAFAVDRFVAPRVIDPGPTADAALIGAQVGSGALRSATWFCAFGTSVDQGTADLTLELGNTADLAATANVALVDDAGHRKDIAVRVGAHERVAVRAGELLVAEHVAAIVESDGGLVVEHTVETPHGASTAPCATVASAMWQFADGATTKDASIKLALFNPFPEEAVVDATFATDRGVARPLALQGIVVPAGQVRVVDVGDSVRRRTAVATSVNTRVGRVVAEELLQFDGTLGNRGSALVPGAPALSDVWFVARVVLGTGITERLGLSNPTAARVRIEVQPLVAEVDLDPISLTLAAHEQTTLNLEDDDRLPRGVGFSMAITADRAALVVQHTTFAASPARKRGVASAIGAPLGATRWVLAGGASTARQQYVVSVFNPTDTPTEVTLRAANSISPTPWQARPLAPGAVLQWRVGDQLDASAPVLEITSSAAEVVVQRELSAVASVASTPRVSVAPAAGAGRLPTLVRGGLSLSRVDVQVSPSTIGLSSPSSSPTSTTSTTASTSTTSTTASTSTTAPTSTTSTTAPPTSSTPVPTSAPRPTLAVPPIRRPSLGISIGPAIPDLGRG